MPRIAALSIASALLVAGPAQPTLAERIDLSGIPRPQPGDLLLRDLHAGSTIESVIGARLRPLRRADIGDDGLTVEDISLHETIARAARRGNAVGRMLAYDLDGDFEISRAEAEQVVAASQRPALRGGSTLDRIFERDDRNGDGKITLGEAAVEPAPNTERWQEEELRRLMTFDSDGDGQLTGTELRKQVEAAFSSVDLDRDGVISAEEFAPLKARVRAALSDLRQSACPIPEVPAGALLLSFGVYDGQTLSSSAVGGQDNETNVTDIVIEPGAEPIYLTLTSYESMIWRVTGATSRVARIVASSYDTDMRGRSAVGVIGLPESRVTVTPGECLRRFYRQADGEAAAAALRRSAGRLPDAMFGIYSAEAISLPSGEIDRYDGSSDLPPPDGFEPTMWGDAIRYWPGGLVDVEPRTVVTPATVERYKVLPSQMGLAQLLGSGAVQREPNSRALRVVKPIAHMPPSMGGTHSEQLIFNADVPIPPGDPVHTCVIHEGSDPVSRSPRCDPPPPIRVIAN